MKQRSRARGKTTKGRRRKAVTPKYSNTAKVVNRPSVSPTTQETEVGRLRRELQEALEQLSASSDVLSVISGSPADVQSVFDMIVASAVRLCGARMGAVFQFDGELIHLVAHHNYSPEVLEVLHRTHPRRPQFDQASGRAILTRTVVQVEDTLLDPNYLREMAHAGNWRSILAVPMLREGLPIGAIVITRNEPGSFAVAHIDLIKNFAAQAVIAIENTRLLNELRESLDQQMATSEVLQVISRSLGDLEPVFQAILENATQLCAAKFGNLYLCEGDAFRTIAMHNVPQAFAEARRRTPLVHPEPSSALGRLRSSERVVHIPDVTAEQGYVERQPRFVTMVELGGFRAMLAVPMHKDGKLIGAIIIYRQEPGTFSEKQIALVENFAAQAVIAIENTRLLNELRERTTAT
ncbi:MAG: GAF domain-containing protein [Xanthobacteraceae bacterium]